MVGYKRAYGGARSQRPLFRASTPGVGCHHYPIPADAVATILSSSLSIEQAAGGEPLGRDGRQVVELLRSFRDQDVAEDWPRGAGTVVTGCLRAERWTQVRPNQLGQRGGVVTLEVGASRWQSGECCLLTKVVAREPGEPLLGAHRACLPGSGQGTTPSVGAKEHCYSASAASGRSRNRFPGGYHRPSSYSPQRDLQVPDAESA